MNNEPLLIHEVNATNRLALYLDTEQHAVESIVSDEIGIVTMRIDRQYRDITLVLDSHIDKAIRHFIERFNYHSHTNYTELRETAIRRYLAFEGYACEFVDLRGYSQGDWAEVVIYRPENESQYLRYNKEHLNAWFAGDIYRIDHERLVTYVDTQDPDNQIERWETVESIGALLDDNILRKQSLEDYLGDFDL